MPLKPTETYPAGGVDSRSNPISMPKDRYRAVHDLWPQQDGSFRLRDGYALLANGLQPNVPIHSIVSVVGPGPSYTPLIVFWQNTTPYIYDTVAETVTSSTLRGQPIQSGSRFCYYYQNGHLHAFNGTDAKWFDGTIWRDIGLPTLTKVQLASVFVHQGLSAITPTEALAVTLTSAS